MDLELVLATDVSRSMSTTEAMLVRQGVVNAIRHPDVVAAIRRGFHGRIAVTYMEWGGALNQRTVVDWMLIADTKSANAFADRLERANMLTLRRTSISGAITFATRRFGQNRFHAKRRVIDIAGDGTNNSGGSVAAARERAVARGLTINGLPIIGDREHELGYPQVRALDDYYRNRVIGGPGAFVVVANGFNDFARAFLKKLIDEIAEVPPPSPPFAPTHPRPQDGYATAHRPG